MPVQDHIHLFDSLDASPEFAPSVQWKVGNRAFTPTVIATAERTLSGNLRVHVLRVASVPKRFKNYQYTLRIYDYGGYTAEERISVLEELQGTKVFLVDNLHCNDGEDHTDYVLPMYFERLGPIQNNLTNDLSRYDVEINLMDWTLE